MFLVSQTPSQSVLATRKCVANQPANFKDVGMKYPFDYGTTSVLKMLEFGKVVDVDFHSVRIM